MNEQFRNTPVRFFILGHHPNDEDSDIDIHEVTETEFMESTGDISYERHTVHENGVNQICLTKHAI